VKILNKAEAQGKIKCLQCGDEEEEKEALYYAYYNTQGELVGYGFCCFKCLEQWIKRGDD